MFPILEAEVVAKRTLAPAIRHVTLRLPSGAAFSFRAGQFIQFPLDARTLRQYSIASPPSRLPLFDLCADISPMGKGSRFIEGLRDGEQVHFRGPFGVFMLRDGERRPLEFVATGAGIAPIRAMIQDFFERGNPEKRIVTLTFGNRSPEGILYADEWSALAQREPSFRFLPTLSQPPADWQGRRGRVTDVLRERRDLGRSLFYICGSPEMVDDTRKALASLGVPDTDVRFEKFT